MGTANISQRLRYLNESAHLLNNVSPAISAHLMSRFYQVAFDQEMDISDAQRRAACGACGNLLIPGWTSSVSKAGKELSQRKTYQASKTATTSPDVEEKSHPENEVVYACSTCGRETRQALPRLPKIQLRPSETGVADSPAPHHENASRQQLMHPPEPAWRGVSKSKSANSSSRRRAKARKQGGLRALLSQKQVHTTSSSQSKDFGLNLMDILKP